jgi:hypothetical protein
VQKGRRNLKCLDAHAQPNADHRSAGMPTSLPDCCDLVERRDFSVLHNPYLKQSLGCGAARGSAPVQPDATRDVLGDPREDLNGRCSSKRTHGQIEFRSLDHLARSRLSLALQPPETHEWDVVSEQIRLRLMAAPECLWPDHLLLSQAQPCHGYRAPGGDIQSRAFSRRSDRDQARSPPTAERFRRSARAT